MSADRRALAEILRRLALYHLAGYAGRQICALLKDCHSSALRQITDVQQFEPGRARAWFEYLRDQRHPDYIMFTDSIAYNALSIRQLADNERYASYDIDPKRALLGQNRKEADRWYRAWSKEYGIQKLKDPNSKLVDQRTKEVKKTMDQIDSGKFGRELSTVRSTTRRVEFKWSATPLDDLETYEVHRGCFLAVTN